MLIAYLHPEGIVWDGSKYVKQNTFKSDSEQRFNIAGKKSNEWIPLQEFGDDFSLLVYSRKFADLPQVMREGNANISKAHVALPADGTAYCWYRGKGFVSRFRIGCYCYDRASRGVWSASPAGHAVASGAS